MEEIEISLDEIKESFGSFLDTTGNSRVFFSGKFGIGKTHFLEDFFKTNSSSYDTYHLYPVNYQIHGSDDVVNLLKYDLLVELSRKNKDIFETKEIKGIAQSSLLFYSWIKENFSTNHVLSSTISVGEYLSNFSVDPVISTLSKLGRPLKSLLEIDKRFQEFKKEYQAGEKGTVEKFEELMRSENSLEPDYISSLVKEKIQSNKGERKSVLILDDMDRMDPDHTFRILNVFSSQFERDGENKFGFDVVIVVADYTNLKHIFHHKYGPKTDFEGYMDKFFTISPFIFDNRKAVTARVDEIVRKIKNEEPSLDAAISESGYIKLLLVHILSKAVEGGLVNLRQLFKANRFQLIDLKKGMYKQDPFADNFYKILDIAIKICLNIFISEENFINMVEKIKLQETISEQRMPFDKYIIAMLRSFDVDLTPSNFYWEDYNISKSTDGFSQIAVEGDRKEDLFYDLLIKYVRDGKYIKSLYDYGKFN